MLEVRENVSLKEYNTFGINVLAKFFVEINHEDELKELFKHKQWSSLPRIVLGGGSNMLFTKDFEGLVIKVNILGIDYLIEDQTVFVSVGAGEVWNNFVNYCVNAGFAGVENLSLIPGCVGASPVQNIGAYGVELKDVFESCLAFEIETKEFKLFRKEDCKFDYRESVFKQELKNKYIICSVKFRLSRIADLNINYGAIQDELKKRNILKPDIKDISQVVSAIRVSKLPDPKTIGNAGSFFKNPIITKEKFDLIHKQFPEIVYFFVGNDLVKLAAGWLIESCGWKGKVVGKTGTWKNQALVLVNHGDAEGTEIFNFSQQIIGSVQEKFGVKLEREVNIF
jgi:UDP-N-acetylmuramate dehydrogenase